jgi:N-ethylmaleimide reductase
MVNYYLQRASNGFMLTESIPISHQGNAYPRNGGLFNDEQIAGWIKVVDAVKKKSPDTIFFCQLSHGGRVTD